MMRLLLLFCTLLLSVGCSQHASIPYPSTPAGGLLRDYYTAPTPDGKKLQEFRELFLEEKLTPAQRIPLEKAMLAIIHQDLTDRALHIAFVLAESNHKLPAEAPEFRRIIPQLIRGLEQPDPQPRGAFGEQWQATGSVITLGYMNPDDYRPFRATIARRLNAPVTSPIEPESNECWTRFGLAGLLCNLGKDGVPGLAEALGHSDPTVRMLTQEVLKYYFDPEIEAENTERDLPDPYTPARMAATRDQLRALIPLLAARLSDPKLHDTSLAALTSILTPATVTPQIREHLLARLTQANVLSIAYSLAALHPACTPALLDYLVKPNDPHQSGAIIALAKIGLPIVPDVIARLPDDSVFDVPQTGDPNVEAPTRRVLREIGLSAIPALTKAAADSPNPLLRQRAQNCLNHIADDARATVHRNISTLNDSFGPHRLDGIEIISQNAPYAAEALPILDRLATSDPQEKIRTAARAAAAKIRALQLPPPAP